MSIRYAMPQITKFSLGSKTVCPAGAELFIFSSPLLRAVAVCVIKKKKEKATGLLGSRGAGGRVLSCLLLLFFSIVSTTARNKKIV